jgi:hypothetical protein
VALRIDDVKERYANQPNHLKVLVAGDSGAGKTLLASTFPGVLYADAEGGLLSVRDRNVHRVTVTSTAVLDELRAALAQAPDVRAKVLGTPVSTIVLDTVDEIARLFVRERLRAEKRETMAMGDWGWLGDSLRALLRGYRNLAMNVIFNVHVKSTEDSETGRVDYKPSIQGSVGDEIAAYVDESFLLVGRPMLDPATGDRIISRHLQTFPDVQHRWVKDRSGKLPQEFPVNFQDDYQRLAQYIFTNVTPDTPPGSAAPATGSSPPSREETAGSSTPPAKPPTPPTPPAAAAAPGPNGDTSGTASADTRTGPAGTATAVDPTVPCTDCGTPLDRVGDENQIIQSTARWKVPLCRDCYVNRKNAKKATPASTTTGA